VVYDCDTTKDLSCNSTTRKCEQVYRYVTTGMSCGACVASPATPGCLAPASCIWGFCRFPSPAQCK